MAVDAADTGPLMMPQPPRYYEPCPPLRAVGRPTQDVAPHMMRQALRAVGHGAPHQDVFPFPPLSPIAARRYTAPEPPRDRRTALPVLMRATPSGKLLASISAPNPPSANACAPVPTMKALLQDAAALLEQMPLTTLFADLLSPSERARLGGIVRRVCLPFLPTDDEGQLGYHG